MHVNDLDTPALTVDLDVLEDNIQRMQAFLDERKIRCRPHIKTHKIPAIAHMQLKAGAKGVTCQTLAEAEAMAASGIDDILLCFNIVGRNKLERLARLAARTTIAVAVDSDIVARGISEAATGYGSTVGLVVECDTGGRRTGVPTPQASLALAQIISGLPAVEFRGIMTYSGGFPEEGYNQAVDAFFRQTLELFAKGGLRAEIVSAHATVYILRDQWPHGITETRPGMYVYYDRMKILQSPATLEQCALTVRCTIVSRPAEDRAIFDAGRKTFSNEGADLGIGLGHIVEHPEAAVYGMSEEHGHADVSSCHPKPEVGERVTVIPNYASLVTSLGEVVYGTRGERIETVWPIAKRGIIH
jgi:D-serine deaminase-like pyridoxal phosphate-dependent protein